MIGPFWQARAGCYSQAALSSNDSKTLYYIRVGVPLNGDLSRIPTKGKNDSFFVLRFVSSKKSFICIQGSRETRARKYSELSAAKTT